jgi:hypothetical protein
MAVWYVSMGYRSFVRVFDNKKEGCYYNIIHIESR